MIRLYCILSNFIIINLIDQYDTVATVLIRNMPMVIFIIYNNLRQNDSITCPNNRGPDERYDRRNHPGLTRYLPLIRNPPHNHHNSDHGICERNFMSPLHQPSLQRPRPPCHPHKAFKRRHMVQQSLQHPSFLRKYARVHVILRAHCYPMADTHWLNV